MGLTSVSTLGPTAERDVVMRPTYVKRRTPPSVLQAVVGSEDLSHPLMVEGICSDAVTAGHRLELDRLAVAARQAEQEGLDQIFTQAGFEWREPGCSMCLGMNEDRLNPGERCASTSNRNFEGRQGALGRTHLMSPAMAAAAAIAGHLVDIRHWDAA